MKIQDPSRDVSAGLQALMPCGSFHLEGLGSMLQGQPPSSHLAASGPGPLLQEAGQVALGQMASENGQH